MERDGERGGGARLGLKWRHVGIRSPRLAEVVMLVGGDGRLVGSVTAGQA